MSATSTLRPLLRKDLHDEDAAAYRWVDAVLDRHIQRAVREYSQRAPLEKKTTLVTVAGSRDIDITTPTPLTPIVRVVATEWPTGSYPPTYVPFTRWGNVITLDVTAAPTSIQNVNVYWHQEHTQHATVDASSTYPPTHDDIMLAGAAGYAALDWTSFASNRVNVGGDDVWGRYVAQANERLRQFREMLDALPQVSRIRSSRVYTPQDARLRSQTTDPGPI